LRRNAISRNAILAVVIIIVVLVVATVAYTFMTPAPSTSSTTSSVTSVTSSLVSSSVTSTTPTVNENFTIAFYADPLSLDPGTIQYDASSFTAVRLMYEGLITEARQANGTYSSTQFVPAVADSWNHSADYTTWTFHIRQGMTFHDGNPVTLQDVYWSFTVYNWELFTGYVMNLGGFSPNSTYMYQNNNTIKLVLTRPNPQFLSYIGMSSTGFIMDETAIMAHGGVTPNTPVQWLKTGGDAGCGPYELVQWIPGQKLVFERFSAHGSWGELYNLPQAPSKFIIFNTVPEFSTQLALLRSGAVNMLGVVSPQDAEVLQQVPGIVLKTSPTLSTFSLNFNTHIAPFNSSLVREALLYSFPYQQVLSGVVLGYGTNMTSIVPTGMTTHTGQYWNYSTDLTKAQQLLTQAGYPKGFSFTLPLGTAIGVPADQIAEVWQNNLAQIGVTMTIQLLPQSVYASEEGAGQTSFCAYYWTSFAIDPYYQLFFLMNSKAPTNFCGYDNPKVDSLFQQGLDSSNVNLRTQISQEIQQIAITDSVGIFIYQPSYIVAMGPNVGGYYYHYENEVHAATLYSTS